MKMTSAEFVAYEARRSKVAVNSDGVDDETELHNDIVDECARLGWIPFHGSMAHKTHRVAGEPDFLILADNGKLIAVECKSRHGKLSTAQLGIIVWAKNLGHTIHVVSSLEDFIAVIKTPCKTTN